MNYLYDVIRERCEERMRSSAVHRFAAEKYDEAMWFEEADKLLQSLQEEGLVDSVSELESMIDFNRGVFRMTVCGNA